MLNVSQCHAASSAASNTSEVNHSEILRLACFRRVKARWFFAGFESSRPAESLGFLHSDGRSTTRTGGAIARRTGRIGRSKGSSRRAVWRDQVCRAGGPG